MGRLKNISKRVALWRSKDQQKVLSPMELARALRRHAFDKVKLPIKQKLNVTGYLSNLKLSKHYSSRAGFMAITVGLAFTLMLARYAYLSFLPSDMRNRLRAQASKQFETDITLAPPRAQIVDRTGRTLAVSVLHPSIFILPKRIPKDAETQRKVASQLGIPRSHIEDLARSKKNFAWVRRQMTPTELEKLGDLSNFHDFLGVTEEPKRIYPEKELASHLIGFVGLDNLGLEGIESVYNAQLNGEAVTAKVTRDARGRITLITPNGAVKPEPSTPPLKLSIDLSIQNFAEMALRDGVLKARAKAGSVVAMDIETGELLAIASYPTYDLNAPPDNQPEKRRFRPIMDALELGSVVKPIFISQALDKGIMRKTDGLYCENGAMSVPGGKIHDTHKHGWLNVSEIIKVSSNICTYKIVQKLGRKMFRDTVVRSGLGRFPGTGLPGEWPGRISEPDTWREMRFANMAFGQGISISALQLTKSMAILTGGGLDRGVRVLAKDENEAEIHGPHLRYVSEGTSKTLTEMMQTVVEEDGGTGQAAAIGNVTVAGKTGTAQKFDQQTKSYSQRTSTFVGVIPAENPKIAITVVIDEPQVRPAYGGLLAGPVFSEIGSKTLHYLNALGLLAIDTGDTLHIPLANSRDTNAE